MNDKIEEFAKGIAKPPSEQTLEVLLEKVIKPDNILPMKDVPSMAQRQGVTEQVRPLDFDMGQGGQPSQGPRSSGSSALVEPRFQQTSQQQEPGVMITGSDPPPQLPLITGKQAARNGKN